MSVLDDFVRMRLYRERASEFELLAEAEDSPDARLRYRIVAKHYRELAEREEKADKARMDERLRRLRAQRLKPAATQTTLSAESDAAQLFLIAAEWSEPSLRTANKFDNPKSGAGDALRQQSRRRYAANGFAFVPHTCPQTPSTLAVGHPVWGATRTMARPE
jgi:hypothetical protein